MKIIIFLEGSPGHEKQSLAIGAALQRMANVEVKKVLLNKQPFSARVLDMLRCFFCADGGCRYDIHDANLVIGTGSKTHIPLLACKKKYGIPAIACMAPDFPIRKFFDLCLVPRHDGLNEGGNIFLTDGPPVLSPPKKEREERNGLILLGGVDKASHIWNDEQMVAYIAKIVRSSSEVNWIVSSSPRTPARTVELTNQLMERVSNMRFYHFKETGPGWVEEQYARSRYAWVTADSISMVYEAVTAGCKVGIIPVEWKKSKNKFQRSIDHLFERKLAFPLNDISSWKESPNVKTLNEAERCAAEILARFG